MKRSAVLLCLFITSVCAISNKFEHLVRELEQEPLEDGGKHWALLAAGSNGYDNYRHQADICHAYQILHAHGVPDEQIVVMMYDDIAENELNPVKGNIINRPNGTNVYEGVPKDYNSFRGVNPEIFLYILRGEQDKVPGKVINSGPNDHVFVNFADHGGPGMLSFGMFSLRARRLVDTIKYMHDNNRYKKLVIYVEACESGSMFYKLLPDDINVYVTTASSPHESSYACCYDPVRQTYLGDVYSVKWMEDSDKEDLNSETLQEQFALTKQQTNTSHVQEYGDLTIGEMTVAEFQGMQAATNSAPSYDPYSCGDAVKSEDVSLEILRRRLEVAESNEEAVDIETKLAELLEMRNKTDEVVKSIVEKAAEDNSLATEMMESRQFITQWDCYEEVLDLLEEQCHDHLNIPQNDYALRKLYMFVNMCEHHIPLEKITGAIEKVCIDDEM